VPGYIATGKRISDIRICPLFSSRGDDARSFFEAARGHRDIGSDAYVHGRRDLGPWAGEIRNVWKPTRQRGLWFHNGNFGLMRFFSRILALQIKARHAGLPTPIYGLA
jgi:hypothetical protein